MKKPNHFYVSVFVSVVVAVLATFFTLQFVSKPSSDSAAKESVYDRVMRAGELRCGYATWPGLIEKDPNTGNFSGVFYDYMNELGKAAELKVVFTEEVPFGDMAAALNGGRVDAICSGAWTNAIRGKFVDFITPVAYQAISPFVRANDVRFDADITKINDPSVTISVVDGESAETIAKADFPNAKTISMPKGTEGAQMILNVIDGKADIAFLDLETANRVMQSQPGKLRMVNSKFPARVFGVPVLVKKNEPALKNMLDNATQQLLMTGVIDRILTKYEKTPGTFLRVQQPYQMPAAGQ